MLGIFDLLVNFVSWSAATLISFSIIKLVTSVSLPFSPLQLSCNSFRSRLLAELGVVVIRGCCCCGGGGGGGRGWVLCVGGLLGFLWFRLWFTLLSQFVLVTLFLSLVAIFTLLLLSQHVEQIKFSM